MASKFITNTNGEKSLSERIQGLTKSSSKLDFLVGYFFFSGFCEIYKEIADKPLRILVGMDAEVDLNNCIYEYTTELGNKKNTDSKLTIRNKYFESLKKAINKADNLDTKEMEDSYRLFVEKLDNGTLEVKKTKDPNHAKMYLFYIPPEKTTSGEDESKLIIGSSNFSLQGLKARNEVNVFLQEEADFTDAKKIFETLWNEAIPLVNVDNKDEFKENVLAHTWLEALPTPYLMYIRVLYEYFKVSKDYIKTPKELTSDGMTEFFDVSYQIDAIRDGVAKIKKHSGVIVADVVGLGKSIIASAIAANLDCKTVIVCPPHLKTQWEDYASDFRLRGYKVYTSGKLEEAVMQNKNAQDLVVIIDEAHRYRNENTVDYGFLHQLCMGNKVILLSATPFNNRPEDIFSLIKLFQIPAHSTIQTVNDLGNQMEQLVIEYKKLKKDHRDKKANEAQFNKESNALAEKIREILDPVIIRRTRVDLEKLDKYKSDLDSQNIKFSDVQPPISQSYELGDLSPLYIKTLNNLTGAMEDTSDEKDDEDEESKITFTQKNNSQFGFYGARYKPLTYLKKDTKDKNKIDKKLINKYKVYFDDVENFASGQRNMAEFMKQLLVRRFESSKYSFIKTLENINKSMLTLKRWYTELHRIPMIKKVKLPDIDEILELLDDTTDGLFSEDDILQSTLSKENEKGVWYIDSADLSPDFEKELNSDIALITSFINDWKATKEDPKLNSIIKTIQSSIKKEPNRKIIIFTEFSDTADYLQEEFTKEKIRSMMYSSKVASKNKRETIRYNFDAGCSANLQVNDYDVLIATDAISEGFSLHRAGTIYNYDIPYNPTRVIQRVGRINRVNKKMFDKLYIYNFFPTATGEEISHTAEISTFKMKLFQAILGADTKILTTDETIDGYLGAKFTEAENEANSISWDVPFRNELNALEKEKSPLLEMAKELPQRCRLARKNVNYKNAKEDLLNQELFEDIKEKGVLLFSKKGDSYRFCFTSLDGSTVLMSPEQALTLFKATEKDEGTKVTDAFYSLYERAKVESGHVKTTRQKSKTIQETLIKINILLRTVTNENQKEYLEAIRNVISWDSIPSFYMKKIAKMKETGEEAITNLKTIISDKYLETILEKNNKVDSEPETILLSEELQ